MYNIEETIAKYYKGEATIEDIAKAFEISIEEAEEMLKPREKIPSKEDFREFLKVLDKIDKEAEEHIVESLISKIQEKGKEGILEKVIQIPMQQIDLFDASKELEIQPHELCSVLRIKKNLSDEDIIALRERPTEVIKSIEPFEYTHDVETITENISKCWGEVIFSFKGEPFELSRPISYALFYEIGNLGVPENIIESWIFENICPKLKRTPKDDLRRILEAFLMIDEEEHLETFVKYVHSFQDEKFNWLDKSVGICRHIHKKTTISLPELVDYGTE